MSYKYKLTVELKNGGTYIDYIVSDENLSDEFLKEELDFFTNEFVERGWCLVDENSD